MNGKNIESLLSKDEQQIISIIRFFSMFLIILCHYVGWFPRIAWTSQLFNVGVPLFFIISGFLYGSKQILSTKLFYIKRFKRIIVPLYVYYIIMIIVLNLLNIIGNINIINVMKVILCIHGFTFGGGIGNVITAHLWFISYILLCYLFTPLLQNIKGHFPLRYIIAIFIDMCVFINTIMVLLEPPQFMVWFVGVVSYCIAYYIGKNRHFLCYTFNRFIFCMFGVVLTLILRLIFKKYLDSEDFLGKIYSRCIAIDLHCILAFFIFFFIILFLKTI